MVAMLKYNVNTDIADLNCLTPLDFAKEIHGPSAAELIDILSVKESRLMQSLANPQVLRFCFRASPP
jgi:hypothetical protein